MRATMSKRDDGMAALFRAAIAFGFGAMLAALALPLTDWRFWVILAYVNFWVLIERNWAADAMLAARGENDGR